MSYLSLWNQKTKLNDVQLDKVFPFLEQIESLTGKNKKRVFISSIVLYQRREHETYIENLKSNLKLKGCFDDDVDFVCFILYDNEEHFASAILDKKDKKLCYYDSLDMFNIDEFGHLRKSLCMTGLIDENCYTKVMDFHRQEGVTECGFYVLFSFYLLSLFGEVYEIEAKENDKEHHQDVELMLKQIDESLPQKESVKQKSVTFEEKPAPAPSTPPPSTPEKKKSKDEEEPKKKLKVEKKTSTKKAQ